MLLHFARKVSRSDEPGICKLGWTELLPCEDARAIMIWRVCSVSRVVGRDYAALSNKQLPSSKGALGALTRVIAVEKQQIYLIPAPRPSNGGRCSLVNLYRPVQARTFDICIKYLTERSSIMQRQKFTVYRLRKRIARPSNGSTQCTTPHPQGLRRPASRIVVDPINAPISTIVQPCGNRNTTLAISRAPS